MENKFEAHIYLMKEEKQIYCFSCSFRNRSNVGDLIDIDECVSGEMAYYENECEYDHETAYKLSKTTISELKKYKITRKSKAIVYAVSIYPIVNFSCVDFSIYIKLI